MQLIHPINQEECQPIVGMYVCAVTQDGTRHYGVLSRTDKEKLVLNDNAASADGADSPTKAKGVKKPKAKAKIKSNRTGKVSIKALTKETLEALQAEPEIDDWYEYDIHEQEAEHTYDDGAPYGNRTVLKLSSIAYMYPVMF